MAIRINPSYCLEVSTAEFIKAIKVITRKSKRNDPGFFEIIYSSGNITCRGLDDNFSMPARGDWIRPVRVSAISLKKLVKSMPGQEYIRLGYLDERFYIDNFSIQAFAIDPS